MARIRSQKDFRAAFNYNLFVKKGLITLFIAPNGLSRSRFGVSISAKTASAAVRNRFKRLAIEAFMLSQNEIPQGLDYRILYSPILSKPNRSGINPIGGKASNMPDRCAAKPASNKINRITLNEIKQDFIELVRQVYNRFEKRQNK